MSATVYIIGSVIVLAAIAWAGLMPMVDEHLRRASLVSE